MALAGCFLEFEILVEDAYQSIPAILHVQVVKMLCVYLNPAERSKLAHGSELEGRAMALSLYGLYCLPRASIVNPGVM